MDTNKACLNMCIFFCLAGKLAYTEIPGAILPDDLAAPNPFAGLRWDCIRNCLTVCRNVVPLNKIPPLPIPNFISTKMRLLSDGDVLMPDDLNEMVNLVRTFPYRIDAFAHYLKYLYAKRKEKGGGKA